jgi:hypothetical protein
LCNKLNLRRVVNKMNANPYELLDIAEMLATDDTIDSLVALSRTEKVARWSCHEAIKGHLERSEARYTVYSGDGFKRNWMSDIIDPRHVRWLNESYQQSRYCDRPTMITESGTRYWCNDGQIYRGIDPATGRHLPAIIYASGDREWYHAGQLHRSDPEDPTADVSWILPAIIRADGSCAWFFNGDAVRTDAQFWSGR